MATMEEMLRDVNGLFAVLPTEVCHFILAYMDKDSRDAFAKCSRHCYSVAFPSRFSGVKLSEVNHKEWLKVFTRGWLAPLRRWVDTVVLEIADIKYLQAFPPKPAIFPNLRSLKLHIHGPKAFGGNIYVALYASLCKQPYYDNLHHLEISWYGYHIRFGTVGMESYPIFLHPADEQMIRENYDRGMELIPQIERDILGPFLSREEIIEKSLAGDDIRLPKHLKSLELGAGSAELHHFIPFLNCPTVNTLYLDFLPSAVKSAESLVSSLQFPNIKTLVINHVGVYTNVLTIANHFPGLESIIVSKYCFFYWSDFICPISDIKKYSLPWPKMRMQYLEIHLIQREIDTVLTQGRLRCFPTIEFHGSYEIQGNKKDISATCTIIPDGRGSWEFTWEGDVDFKPDPSQLTDFEQEILRETETDSDISGSEEEEEDDDYDEDPLYVDIGSEPYRPSEDSESEEDGYSGDSEYWNTDDEVHTESDESDDDDALGNL
ncbi:hypothetical protein TWF281_004755 [Arthrobotrys megalospora]